MSSGQVIPFTRQYNSFRSSNGLTNYVTSDIRRNGSATAINTNTNDVITRGSLSSRTHRTPTSTTMFRGDKASLTPRLAKKNITTGQTCSKNHCVTNKLNMKSSPLRSPQIIRSTRIDSNWNKRVVKNGVHSKSPGSSGTSVESIVPKYGNNSALYSTSTYGVNNNNTGGPQKRAYNINSSKLSNKMVNTRNQDRNTTLINNNNNNNNKNGHHHSLNNGIKHNSTNGHITSNNNQNHYNHKLSSIKSSKENNYTSYSSKYPNGLPFEDEFYHRRRKSLSETSSNTISSSDSSDSRNFPLEDDEFSRKPSNEALYVDFTKSFQNNESKLSTTNRLFKTTALSSQMKKSTNKSNKAPLSEYNRRINGVHSSCNTHSGHLETVTTKKATSASVINGNNKNKQFLQQHLHHHNSGSNSISNGNNNNNSINNNFVKATVTVKPVANYLSGSASETLAITSWASKSKQPITTILTSTSDTEDDYDDDLESDISDEGIPNRSNSESDYSDNDALKSTINGSKYVFSLLKLAI